MVIFAVLYADIYPSVLWQLDYNKEFEPANEYKLAECPHSLCRRKTHVPKSNILIPDRLCEVNGSHILVRDECILKTESSVHKKPLTETVTLAATLEDIQIP